MAQKSISPLYSAITNKYKKLGNLFIAFGALFGKTVSKLAQFISHLLWQTFDLRGLHLSNCWEFRFWSCWWCWSQMLCLLRAVMMVSDLSTQCGSKIYTLERSNQTWSYTKCLNFDVNYGNPRQHGWFKEFNLFIWQSNGGSTLEFSTFIICSTKLFVIFLSRDTLYIIKQFF